MATPQEIAELGKALKRLESIDEQRLFRPNLGDESLQSELKPRLNKVCDKARFAFEYASAVADEPVRGMTGELDGSYEELNAQAERESSEYIQYKTSVLNGLDARHAAMLEALEYSDIECRPIRKRNSKKDLVEFDVVARWSR